MKIFVGLHKKLGLEGKNRVLRMAENSGKVEFLNRKQQKTAAVKFWFGARFVRFDENLRRPSALYGVGGVVTLSSGRVSSVSAR
jgi:hypothetical protein